MGIEVDEELNTSTVGGKRADIGTPASLIKVLVIPTDEELSIAQQTLGVALTSGEALGGIRGSSALLNNITVAPTGSGIGIKTI